MNNPQRPVDWVDDMTHFVQALIPEGEDTESATIVFKTEYSEMAGKYQNPWPLGTQGSRTGGTFLEARSGLIAGSSGRKHGRWNGGYLVFERAILTMISVKIEEWRSTYDILA